MGVWQHMQFCLWAAVCTAGVAVYALVVWDNAQTQRRGVETVVMAGVSGRVL